MGALWGALENEFGLLGPELQAIILAWPNLPEAFRTGILAMVKASGGRVKGNE